jgi:hypothetical protein
MSFSGLAASLNAVALAAFTNAVLRWTGGQADVLFDLAYLDTMGMANNAPRVRALSSAVDGLDAGAAVTVDAVAYTVQAVEPDGLGMTTLILRRA